MVLWDGVKNGAVWGLCLGMGLGIITTLLDLSSNNPELADPTTVVIYVIIWAIIGAELGSIVAVILAGIIGTIKFFNWLFIFLGGTLLTILVSLMGSLVGWLSVSLIPILLFLRQYLSEKSPTWIEQALNQVIVTFLYSLILTFLVFCFQSLTGITLLGV